MEVTVVYHHMVEVLCELEAAEVHRLFETCHLSALIDYWTEQAKVGFVFFEIIYEIQMKTSPSVFRSVSWAGCAHFVQRCSSPCNKCLIVKKNGKEIKT